MYEHILVPIDGSGQAAKGLREAIKLAISHQGHIRLVHVLNRAPLASADLSGTRFDALFARRRPAAARTCRGLRAQGQRTR
jgi:nucleotide-binding universal stress UspA family protein